MLQEVGTNKQYCQQATRGYESNGLGKTFTAIFLMYPGVSAIGYVASENSKDDGYLKWRIHNEGECSQTVAQKSG